MLEAMVVNFDAGVDQNGKVTIFESGPGMIRVGYHIDEQIKNRNTTREKIILALLEFYEHVYIVYPKDYPIYAGLNIRETFVKSNKVSLYTLEGMIESNALLNKKGIIIAATEAIPTGQPFHYATVLRSKGITLPVVNDSMLFKAFCEKAQMAHIISQHSPHAIPQQVVVDYDNYTACQSTVDKFKSDYVILKPIDGTRADGIVLIPKTRLMEILKYLADKNEFKVLNIPTSDDPELRLRLHQLDIKANKSGLRMCIVQEYVPPALIKVEGAEFRPTVRFVIVAVFDTETGEVVLRVPEFFYKLPTTPISHHKNLLWEETISYHSTNKQIELENADPFLRMTEMRRLANQPPKTKYPYIVLIPDDLRKIVTQDVVRSLTPVFLSLFKTGVTTYYDQGLSQNNSFSKLLCQTLRLTIYRNLNEEMCAVFKKHDVNVVLILLYYLHIHIKIYKNIEQLCFDPAVFAALLLKHRVDFGMKLEEGIEELKALVTAILQASLLPEIFDHANLKSIRDLLLSYSQENWDILIADSSYSQGIEKFKGSQYAAATALMTTASQKYPPGKEQATCLYSLASCYIKQELYEKAAAVAKKAVELRQSLLNDNLIEIKDLERAQIKLEQASQLVQADKIAQEGLDYFKKGKSSSDNTVIISAESCYQGALKNFKKAIEIHSKINAESIRLSTYHYNLASCYDKLNMPAEAVNHCMICYDMKKKLLGAENESTKTAFKKLSELNTKMESLKEQRRQPPDVRSYGA